MDESLYHAFYLQEESHWWFAARSEIVQRVLAAYGNLGPGDTILDIGCGTGAVLKSLAADYDVVGIDTSPLAVEYSLKRGLKKIFEMPVDDFPRERFNVRVSMLLDVIEHIDDDVAVLRAAREIVEPHGRVIVTVPAHMWMWGAHDVVNHHRRRYSKASLRTALERAGLDVVKLTFFNTLLFPLVTAGKLWGQLRGAQTAHVAPSQALVPGNAVLKTVFASEKHLIPRLNLPFGVSLLAVAQPRP